MTTYIVLRFDADLSRDATDGVWAEVARVEARDDKHAIQQATQDPGTYVAVPARSWKPRTRAVETVVKDVWS